MIEQEIPGLDDKQNAIFKRMVLKFFENKSDWYLHHKGAPWSVETDALVYIDDVGVDTASPGDGADFVANKYLAPDEIELLNTNGYIVKGEYLFAYSMFLLENFVKATLLLQRSESSRQHIEGLLTGLIDTVNGVTGGRDVHGEVVEDQKQIN